MDWLTAEKVDLILKLVGGAAGLAMKDGRLYGARLDAGDVVELDPATGAVLRRVADYLSCPSGLAFDPLSGDLFVTLHCAGAVARIADPMGAHPTTTVYSVPGGAPDQLAFNPNGMAYVGTDDGIQMVAATSRPDPGAVRRLSPRTGVVGLAVMPSNDLQTRQKTLSCCHIGITVPEKCLH
jgi:sugar lactone lactonase YvrE